jgi:hypothetical protein
MHVDRLIQRCALAHEHVGTAGEIEHSIAVGAVAGVGKAPAFDLAGVPEGEGEARVVQHFHGFEVQAPHLGQLAGVGLDPLDLVADVQEARVHLEADILGQGARPRRPDDPDRLRAAIVLPVQEDERQPQEVVAVVVADCDGLELVQVHAQPVEGHDGSWRGLKEMPALYNEPVVARTARREGVAGADEREVQPPHAATW